MLHLSVLCPSLNYGNEVWEDNKAQVATVESIEVLYTVCVLLHVRPKLRIKPSGEIRPGSFAR